MICKRCKTIKKKCVKLPKQKTCEGCQSRGLKCIFPQQKIIKDNQNVKNGKSVSHFVVTPELSVSPITSDDDNSSNDLEIYVNNTQNNSLFNFFSQNYSHHEFNENQLLPNNNNLYQPFNNLYNNDDNFYFNDNDMKFKDFLNSNIFDFSGLLQSPIPDPSPNYSFIKEFSTEEGLAQFINEDIPVAPNPKLENALVTFSNNSFQVTNLNLEKELLEIYFIIFSYAFKTLERFEFLVSPGIWEGKGFNKKIYKDFTEYWTGHSFDVDFCIKKLNKPDKSNIFMELAQRALLCNHPILFSKDNVLGDSPSRVALRLAEKGYVLFKSLPIGTLKYNQIDSMTTYVSIKYLYGEKNNALKVLSELHEMGIDLEFDKITGINCTDFITDPKSMYKRRLEWVRFFNLATFITYPNLLGNEEENLDLKLQSEWDQFHSIKGNEFYGWGYKVTDHVEMMFFARRSIRFRNLKSKTPKMSLEITNSIHNDLLVWLDELPVNVEEKKTTKKLSFFG
ncbi:hypothetical protein HDU92_005709 [Lobulomyces angularis]|nr:hypothetical protein HDU92_005709 [Lobulomyces angularis]